MQTNLKVWVVVIVASIAVVSIATATDEFWKKSITLANGDVIIEVQGE